MKRVVIWLFCVQTWDADPSDAGLSLLAEPFTDIEYLDKA